MLLWEKVARTSWTGGSRPGSPALARVGVLLPGARGAGPSVHPGAGGHPRRRWVKLDPGHRGEAPTQEATRHAMPCGRGPPAVP